MIWLTWRQFRIQAAVVAAGSWPPSPSCSWSPARTWSPCTGTAPWRPAAATAAQDADNFLNSLSALAPYHLVYLLGALLIILLPAVIGLFWGAPLIARELETGTFRLAWNQSVTRERWLAVKLGILGLASHGRAPGCSAYPRLVGQPHRPRGHDRGRRGLPEPFLPGGFRHPRDRADRLRGVRLRARRAGGPDDPPHHPGHGGHAGRDRRGPDRLSAGGPAAPDHTGPCCHDRAHRRQHPGPRHQPRTGDPARFRP